MTLLGVETAGRRAAALVALLLALVPPAPALGGAEPAAVTPACTVATCAAGARDVAGGAADGGAPVVASARTPSAEVSREFRGDAPPRPPSRRLPHFALAPEPDACAAHRPAASPDDGVDVPACRSAGRWCLAHATSTSPA